MPAYETIGARFVRRVLPKRKADTHKGDYGKLLLLCGSVGFTGAAALAAMGALRGGAGLVYLGVPEPVYPIVAGKLLEAIVFPLPSVGGTLSREAIPEIEKRLCGVDAVLLGPGLGRSDDVSLIVQAVLKQSGVPVVLDADGINAICTHKDVLRECACPKILTPHEGEFARLSDLLLTSPREQAALNFAKQMRCVCVLKGHRTVISDGMRCAVNRTGNPGMATGGSGDVLAGLLTALIGQGLSPFDAAASAVWLHGKAGDFCAAKIGQYAMLPSDLLTALPRLLP